MIRIGDPRVCVRVWQGRRWDDGQELRHRHDAAGPQDKAYRFVPVCCQTKGGCVFVIASALSFLTWLWRRYPQWIIQIVMSQSEWTRANFAGCEMAQQYAIITRSLSFSQTLESQRRNKQNWCWIVNQPVTVVLEWKSLKPQYSVFLFKSFFCIFKLFFTVWKLFEIFVGA